MSNRSDRESFWRREYEKYVRSGLSRRDYCARAGLNKGTFSQAVNRYKLSEAFSLGSVSEPSHFAEINNSQAKQISQLEEINNSQAKQISQLEEINGTQANQISQLEDVNKRQAERIFQLEKRLFGKKSEKSTKKSKKGKGSAPKQRDGFNDDEEHPAGFYPSHLPRKEQASDNLPQGADPDDYYYVGEKATERLAVCPSQFYVIVTRHKIYKRKSDGSFPPSHAPEHPLGRCSVDISFVIFSIIQKILFHVPFYRIEKMLELQGISCHRSNLIRWSTKLGDLLQPVVAAILREIKSAPAVHGDESPIIVNCKQKEKSKTYRTTYFWNLVAPGVGIFFRWTSNRNNKEALETLKGITGTFVSDALKNYTYATQTLCLTWQICWIHIRRNFLKVARNHPLGQEALDEINLFLAIDKAIRRRTRSQESYGKRVQYRKRFLLPLITRMKEWIREKKELPEVQSDKELLSAIEYLDSRWDQATCFVTNPYVLPHNNISEQFFRYLKLGAKNWLFCSSELGAHTLCILYTLIGSDAKKWHRPQPANAEKDKG